VLFHDHVSLILNSNIPRDISSIYNTNIDNLVLSYFIFYLFLFCIIILLLIF